MNNKMNKLKRLTIFTPTYNRDQLLPKLYASLCQQTNKNFVWSIVDDGSTDGTKSLIREYINENKIDIVYFYQKNSGKYVAHNTGVLRCTTELILCVDSDD